MEILVNGNTVDVTLEGEQSLGEVLVAFEKSCAAENATITGIEIDGRAIAASEIESESKRPLDEVNVLALSTISAAGIRGVFSELSGQFSGLAPALSDIPAQLQSGKKEDAYTTIQTLACAIDSFCSVAPYLQLFPGQFAPLNIDGKTPDAFFGDFAPVLNGFCAALEKGDIVTIGDLAEYEICPRIAALSRALKEQA